MHGALWTLDSVPLWRNYRMRAISESSKPWLLRTKFHISSSNTSWFFCHKQLVTNWRIALETRSVFTLGRVFLTLQVWWDRGSEMPEWIWKCDGSRSAARLQGLVGHNKILGGKDFCSYYMFETNLFWRKKIWMEQKNFGEHCPRLWLRAWMGVEWICCCPGQLLGCLPSLPKPIAQNWGVKQARNELGTPEGSNSFLGGVQIFELCPTVLNYGQNIFPGGTNIF